MGADWANKHWGDSGNQALRAYLGHAPGACTEAPTRGTLWAHSWPTLAGIGRDPISELLTKERRVNEYSSKPET